MSREIKGTVKFRSGVWQVLATQQDGSRKWFPIPGVPELASETARTVGAHMARMIRRGEFVPNDRGETVGEYARRWCDAREKKGLASHNEDRSIIRHYVDVTIGAQPIEAIKPEHLRTFVAGLDSKVEEKIIRAKRARNVWGVVRKMFVDAAGSKIDALRVLEVNPALSVAPPDRASGKTRKQYLYPSEFLALVSSPKVPIWRARIYAYSVYVWTRAGELAAQTWHGVDLTHGVIRVHESIDRDRRPKSRETTKTSTERMVAIEAELRGLLIALANEASKGFNGVSVHVAPPHMAVFARLPRVSGDAGLAALLRRDLAAAGVDRADLFNDTETRRRMTFHDLRATGITWAAVRGDKPLEIQERAGHSTFAMTQQYIREASVFSRPGVVFGDVFPMLPARLISGSDEAPISPEMNRTSIVQSYQDGPDLPGNSWAQQDLNPRQIDHEPPRKDANGREDPSSNRTSRSGSWKSDGFVTDLSGKLGSSLGGETTSGGTVSLHVGEGVSVSTLVLAGEPWANVMRRLQVELGQKGWDLIVAGPGRCIVRPFASSKDVPS